MQYYRSDSAKGQILARIPGGYANTITVELVAMVDGKRKTFAEAQYNADQCDQQNDEFKFTIEGGEVLTLGMADIVSIGITEGGVEETAKKVTKRSAS